MHSGPHLPRLVAIWLRLAAVYVLLVGSLSVNEAIAGATCASLGAAWWAFAARRSGIRFRVSGPLLKMLIAPILALPGSILQVGASLARALTRRLSHGSLRRPPEAETGWARADGPSAPAVRAVGLLAASLTPDSYVLRLDPRGAVIEHALSDREAGA